jgi:hypothetical protein
MGTHFCNVDQKIVVFNAVDDLKPGSDNNVQFERMKRETSQEFGVSCVHAVYNLKLILPLPLSRSATDRPSPSGEHPLVSFSPSPSLAISLWSDILTAPNTHTTHTDAGINTINV